MPGRRKSKAQTTNRTTELREQAKHVAEESGDALKAFAEATGTAAKEFGQVTRKATKELISSVEHAAAQDAQPPKRKRRGRKLVGALVLAGIGVAVASGSRIRELISGPSTPPEPWQPPASGGTPDGATSPATETETETN